MKAKAVRGLDPWWETGQSRPLPAQGRREAGFRVANFQTCVASQSSLSAAAPDLIRGLDQSGATADLGPRITLAFARAGSGAAWIRLFRRRNGSLGVADNPWTLGSGTKPGRFGRQDRSGQAPVTAQKLAGHPTLRMSSCAELRRPITFSMVARRSRRP